MRASFFVVAGILYQTLSFLRNKCKLLEIMPFFKVNDFKSVGQTKWEKSQREARKALIKQQKENPNRTKDASLGGGKHRPSPSPGTTNVSMEHRSGKKEHR